MKRVSGSKIKSGAKSCFLAAVAITVVLRIAHATEARTDKGDNVVTGADLAFMNGAAPGGMAEIELSRLAVERAANVEVKQFAQLMIEDHSKAGEKLNELAKQKRVKLPLEILPKAKQTKEKLTTLSGSDFDRDYVRTMLQMHEEDVAAFDAFAKSATDADVKAFAANTLPTLRHHLEMIRQIAEKMNVPAK